MESNTKSNIGKRICELREKKGITQLELAKELFVKRETVNQWENGSRDLKTDYTIKLAEYFDVTCDYLLRGIKAENVSVIKDTGLSDKAVDALKAMNKLRIGEIVTPETKEKINELYIQAEKLKNDNPDKCDNLSEEVQMRLTSAIQNEKWRVQNMFDVLNLLIEKEDEFYILHDLSIYLFADFPELLGVTALIANPNNELSATGLNIQNEVMRKAFMVNIEQKLDMLKSIKPDCVVIGYVENIIEDNL